MTYSVVLRVMPRSKTGNITFSVGFSFFAVVVVFTCAPCSNQFENPKRGGGGNVKGSFTGYKPLVLLALERYSQNPSKCHTSSALGMKRYLIYKLL